MNARAIVTACLAAQLMTAITARAQSKVTLCATDTQGGAGVNLAAALAAGGTISFGCNPGTVIQVTKGYTIARNTVVDGPGITLDRGGGFGLFVIANRNVRLELSGLTLRHGRPFLSHLGSIRGSLIRSNGTLILRRVRIETSEDPVSTTGGVIETYDSYFTDNRGVAISTVWARIFHTAFQNPQADPIMLFGFAGTSSFLSIDNNSTFSSGGPVRATHGLGGSCRLEISRSAFANDHGDQGGALTSGCATFIDHTTFTNNRATSGGAVFLKKDVGQAELRRVEFTGNAATLSGGAIAMEANTSPHTLTLRYCSFVGNSAQDGGAIDLGSAIENAASLSAIQVLFSANVARRAGGAVYGENASATIVQGVFKGNVATQRGGAVALDAYVQQTLVLGNTLLVANKAPAASAVSAAAAALVNTTVADNAGPLFAVFREMPAAAWKGIRLRNTIISAPAGPTACGSQAVQDQGNNLQWPLADCGATIPIADPRLDPLYVPFAGSPALNHGDDGVCAAAPINKLDVFAQRRPENTSCTIGAVEYHIEHLPYVTHPEERRIRPPGLPR